ncbi:MAG: N-acetylmuramoyl-L-alanine amidase [Tepidanaerobacteraceae bacterium]|nr:N-acetylmuramoyl-L-alanine amidase [Tepidanaerobacteraceae bacterium]
MLKKAILVLMLISVFLCFPSLAKAAPKSKTAERPIEIYINDKKIESDVAPIIMKSRTMVPLRVISENLGGSVYWDGGEKTVRITNSSKTILLKINDKKATINGQTVTLDAPAIIIKDRTMVPLRFIGESLGAQVYWDNDARRVTIIRQEARQEASIIGFSYGTLNGNPTIVLKGDVPLEYAAEQTQDKDKIVLDIKGKIAVENNALYIYDDYIEKAVIGSVQQDPPLSRVVVDLKGDVPCEISTSEDKSSIFVSFVNALKNINVNIEDSKVSVNLVTIKSTGINYFFLTNPDRLVLDIENALLSVASPELPENGYIERIRLGQFAVNPNTVRVVFDLKADVNYQVFQDKNNISVIFSEVNTVKQINVESGKNSSAITIVADGDIGYELKPDRANRQLSLVIPGVGVDKKLLEKETLDINDGIVKSVELKKVKGSKNYDLQIIVNLNSFTSYELATTPPSSEIKLVIYKSPLQNKVIVVDPGHGGSDPGACCGNVQEKDLNLDIGLKVKDLLEQRGAKVLMTRDKDISVNLYTRAGMANEINADLFISIHINAGENASASGTETLYYPDPEKKALAQAIQKSLVKAIGLADRGIVERPGLVVTRETRMPSALVEVGFITNNNDRALLLREDFRQKAAEGIVNGIMNYLTGKLD